MSEKIYLEREANLSKNPVLTLASMSPRRRELMSLGGWTFNIFPADVDESTLPEESPQAYVSRLAKTKARAAAQNAREEAIIIAADTTVADKDDILGKPKDAHEATTMLQSLRGRSHQVLTALAVFQASTGIQETALATTNVPMRNYTDAEVQAYIATGDPFDKAGSYAIQHPDFKPVEMLTGCYANVVGLPLCHLLRTLEKFGILPQFNLPQACQRTLQYQCDVYESVLKGEL